MQVSYFETARYQVPPGVRAEWPVPPAAYDPDAGAQAYQGMIDRVQYVEELGFDWVSVSEHHYSPRILTPKYRGFGLVHRRPVEEDKDRRPRPDRLAEQSGSGGRGAGHARHPVAGTAHRRDAARHDQRIPDLRPQPGRGARAYYRGHGADPQSMDRAAAFRLAGPPFPFPHGIGLAAPVAAAPAADLFARHEPRILRVRGTPSYRSRRLLRAVRGRRQIDAVLPRGMRA